MSNPAADGKPTAAVIRKLQSAEESAQQRLVRKHIPAWVASGAVHVALVGALLAVDTVMAKPAPDAMSMQELLIVTDDKPPEEPRQNLTETTIGFDPTIPTAIEHHRLEDVNIQDKVVTDDPPGLDLASSELMQDFNPPKGIGPDDLNPGSVGTMGDVREGLGGGAGAAVSDALKGRGGATRSRLAAERGGNSRSEAAVARGLIWLAKQQRRNGMWEYDGFSRADSISATGMALLPFLAAGQTHKVSKDNKYNTNVEAGLKYLISRQEPSGRFKGAGMYAQAIATVAVCEAYGMTGDRGLLQRPAQLAVNFIQKSQGVNGSWGYQPNQTGDTSIVGWQVQALHSARLCKDLVVDTKTLERARRFLDSVASGPNRSRYGYLEPTTDTPTRTAVGLLCRYYADGWGPNNPGMAAGVGYLLKTQPPDRAKMDMYYYYYATQVLHFFEGPEWYKDWNPKMRDLLIDLQVPQGKGAVSGSWEAGEDQWIGANCGRLGMTCMALLTLEVYYRHLPTYKRGAGGLKELERVK